MKLYNVATICHKKGQFSLREKQITGLLDAFKDHRHTTAIKYNEVERERERAVSSGKLFSCYGDVGFTISSTFRFVSNFCFCFEV